MASNHFFEIDQDDTTPTIDAALLTDAGQVVGLVGASVTFSLYELGGDEIFTRAATIVSSSAGHVRYTWQPGDTATPGRFLARFHVLFASLETRDFPEDRYIRVTVNAS